MDDFDVAWERARRGFWTLRRRELAAHLGVYAVINIYLLSFASGLPVTTAPDFLRAVGIWNIPWITIHWGVIALIHVISYVAAAGWERGFRRALEYELVWDASEKPKMHSRRLELREDSTRFDDEPGAADEAYYRM